eukprot:2458224-Rhodomonas_salina.1
MREGGMEAEGGEGKLGRGRFKDVQSEADSEWGLQRGREGGAGLAHTCSRLLSPELAGLHAGARDGRFHLGGNHRRMAQEGWRP